IPGQRFRPHSDLAKAWVYTPLEHLSTNEVWTYLLQTPSPWGGSNHSLVGLYKQASGGECPLVIDDSTPSCGQSRFGCWTCTVVEKDKSIEAMVDAGEAELEPLLELRDYLKELRTLPGSRMDLRRNGLRAYNRQGELMTGTGPFTFEVRRDILRRLLSAQRHSGLTLIEGDELAGIHEIWSREEAVRGATVQQIWNEVFGGNHMSAQVGPAKARDREDIEDELLRRICDEHGVSFDLVAKLRDAEDRVRHLKRRHGLPEEMREIVRGAVRGK